MREVGFRLASEGFWAQRSKRLVRGGSRDLRAMPPKRYDTKSRPRAAEVGFLGAFEALGG